MATNFHYDYLMANYQMGIYKDTVVRTTTSMIDLIPNGTQYIWFMSTSTQVSSSNYIAVNIATQLRGQTFNIEDASQGVLGTITWNNAGAGLSLASWNGLWIRHTIGSDFTVVTPFVRAYNYTPNVIPANEMLAIFHSGDGRWQLGNGMWYDYWRAFGLSANWTNYDGTWNQAAYYKGNNNMIYLRGLVKKSIAVVADEVICTLPVGFRPQYRNLRCSSTNPNVPCRVDVDASGNVRATAACDAGWTSFDGIFFEGWA